MKWTAILLYFFSLHALSATGVKGKVETVTGCSDKIMVWVALDKENFQERQLLLHTLVPSGGSFQFFLKSGNYELWASDEVGCEFLQKIEVTNNVIPLNVKLVKK